MAGSDNMLRGPWVLLRGEVDGKLKESIEYYVDFTQTKKMVLMR